MAAEANASGAPVAEHQKPILDHIPETLKRLALFIAKSFFGREHYVVMDYIVKLECIREEDLRNILKFEQKYLRQLVLQLRQDKLLKERQGTEEFEGKQRKINYYFVNYRAIVNVAKYKVDHMRQRLEAREKTKTHRASYKCSGCSHHYDALDMDKIFDLSTMTLVCYLCQGTVENDTTVGPDSETRSSLAKFNEQMTVMFSMIQQLDGIRLAPHLLEPPLNTAISHALQQQAAPQRLAVGERAFRNTEANRSEMFRTDMGITVNIDDGNQVVKVEQKAAVPWLEAGAHDPGLSLNDSLTEDKLEPTPAKKPRAKDEEILGLLREELETDSGAASADHSQHAPSSSTALLLQEEGLTPTAGPTDFAAAGSSVRDEEMMSDDGDDYVFVQGTRYHLEDVTTEMVEKMTESEKTAYIEVMGHHEY